MNDDFTKEDLSKITMWGKIIGGIVLLLIAFIILNPIRIVNAGHRALVLNWGAFNGQILDPGFHLIVPIIQNTKTINVQTLELKIEKSQAYSRDLQMVDITSQINYNIIPDQVGEYFQQYNASLEGILIPRLEAAIKSVVAQYSAEELLHLRGEVQGKIFENFKSSVPTVAIITNYSLFNEVFTPEYEAAIEQKQIAQQTAEKAENDLKRIKIEAEQQIETAKASAESIKIQSEAIRAEGGENYVELQWIKAWEAGGAQVPQFITGENSGGFIFNLNK